MMGEGGEATTNINFLLEEFGMSVNPGSKWWFTTFNRLQIALFEQFSTSFSTQKKL
jgi:hypothetical protein